ncbi:MAG: response regulator [Deltaproteobacteria bacterium HGW-Deltaproteobacteria-15]|jgi:DNA-binding NtrC family response regulator|nr:MAG: response regulator [Deltaproteobacteria bacterium HGW-Deltaproteobacteria-15]
MAESALLQGKKILVVDDEPDILDIMEELLKMCRVVKAPNFDTAKELLETQYFDLAVLDIMGVDGYGLLKIANEKRVPAVMLTAHAFNPPNLVRSIREGAASYIPKEEIERIAEFLNDVLVAKATGKDPWSSWQDRLPSSYFEKRWGSAWRDTDKGFWDTFRASLKDRKK